MDMKSNLPVIVFLLIISSFFLSQISAQPGDPLLIPVEIDGKYGYINQLGQIVIQPKYEDAKYFSEGLAVVRISTGDYAYIDSAGNEVLYYQGNGAENFKEGLALVQDYKSTYGFMNKQGDIGITPQYVSARSFSEGLASVELLSQTNGFINKDGEVMINTGYPLLGDFSEGLAWFYILDPNNIADGWYGFINKDGVTAIEPSFKSFGKGFTNGVVTAQDANYLWGVINKKGEWIVAPVFRNERETEYPFYSEGYAALRIDSSHWGYIDYDGNLLTDPIFNFAFPFSEGLALVIKDGTHSFINMEGNVEFVIEDAVTVKSFKSGLAKIVYDDDAYAYINKNGEIVFEYEPYE